MIRDNPGITFEKVVAELQRQLDPDSKVTHNERIKDRLGNSRQFDVVIRGKCGGYEILGVIECKDLSKKVGTPEVDAFVTKTDNLNANFKIIVSRNGFTKPAIREATHYGIQTLSLLAEDSPNFKLAIGGFWFADLYRWNQITVSLLFKLQPDEPVCFDARELRIKNRKVIDWFYNYLLDNHANEMRLGWIVGLEIKFENEQIVSLGDGREYECTGLLFGAERIVDRRRKFTGINGTGFIDWQKNQAIYPAGTSLKSEAVTTDFYNWEVRESDEFPVNGFIHVTITAFESQFDYVDDPIALDVI